MSADPGTIIVYNFKKLGLISQAKFGFGFLLICILVLADVYSKPPSLQGLHFYLNLYPLILFGGVGLICAYGSARTILFLLFPRPILRIEAKGLFLPWQRRFIAWRDLKEATTKPIYRTYKSYVDHALVLHLNTPIRAIGGKIDELKIESSMIDADITQVAEQINLSRRHGLMG
jgi:hypothetical protein